MKEICPICLRTVKKRWLLNIAKYDSLDSRSRMRADICEDCGRKLLGAMRTLIKQNEQDLINGESGEAALVCPKCKTVRTTSDPKIPAPCGSCGTIFSAYSAADKMIEDGPAAGEESTAGDELATSEESSCE